MQTTYEKNNPWDFLKQFYYILLGDFGEFKEMETALNSELFFFILFTVTIILVIVMLNLLISLISDSFANIKAVESQTSLFEKLRIIIDYKNRGGPNPYLEQKGNHYIYFLKSGEAEGSEGEEFTKRIDAFEAQVQKKFEKNERIIATLTEKLDSIEKKIIKHPDDSVVLNKMIEEKFAELFSRLESMEKSFGNPNGNQINI